MTADLAATIMIFLIVAALAATWWAMDLGSPNSRDAIRARFRTPDGK